MKKRLIATVAIIAALCVVLLPASVAEAKPKIRYFVKWTDSGIQVTINAPETGTAYVKILESDVLHYDPGELNEGNCDGKIPYTTANVDASVTVAADATVMNEVYVQFVPDSGPSYSRLVMQLAKKEVGISAGEAASGSLSIGTARWKPYEITFYVTPTSSGTIYYMANNVIDTITFSDVTLMGSQYSAHCSANETTTVSFPTPFYSDFDLHAHLAFKDDDGHWYEGIYVVEVPYYPVGSVNYSAEWADSAHITLTTTPSSTPTPFPIILDGYSYCVVQDQDAAAPTADSVISSGSRLDCTADADNVTTIESTSTGKTIYLVYKTNDNNYTYGMTSIPLPAYSVDQPTVAGIGSLDDSVAYQAERTSDTTITLDATPTTPGTLHYIVRDADADAPTMDEVIASTNTISFDAADTTVTTTIPTTAGAKKLYLRYADEYDVALDGVTTMDIPAYYDAEVLEYDPDFGTSTVGYATAPAAKDITIENTGGFTLALSVKTGSDDFTTTLGTGGTVTLAPGATTTLTVRPKVGLAVGTHDATITLAGTSVGGDEMLTLDVPVEFDVAEPSGPYYACASDSFPLVLRDSGTDAIAFSPVYSINMEQWIGPDGYADRVFFDADLDADASVLSRNAGNPASYDAGTGTYSYYMPDADGDGTLEVRSAEDALGNIKRVLDNGYGGADESATLRSHVESRIGTDSLSGSDADLAFYAATQAAVWHYTDYSRGTTTGSAYSFDDYMEVLSSTNSTIAAWRTSSPRVMSAMEAIYAALIDEDGTFAETTAENGQDVDTFPGGTLVTDMDDVQANVFENLLEDTSSVSGRYLNLISVSSQEDDTSAVVPAKTDDGTKVIPKMGDEVALGPAMLLAALGIVAVGAGLRHRRDGA